MFWDSNKNKFGKLERKINISKVFYRNIAIVIEISMWFAAWWNILQTYNMTETVFFYGNDSTSARHIKTLTNIEKAKPKIQHWPCSAIRNAPRILLIRIVCSDKVGWNLLFNLKHYFWKVVQIEKRNGKSSEPVLWCSKCCSFHTMPNNSMLSQLERQ